MLTLLKFFATKPALPQNMPSENIAPDGTKLMGCGSAPSAKPIYSTSKSRSRLARDVRPGDVVQAKDNRSPGQGRHAKAYEDKPHGEKIAGCPYLGCRVGCTISHISRGLEFGTSGMAHNSAYKARQAIFGITYNEAPDDVTLA